MCRHWWQLHNGARPFMKLQYIFILVYELVKYFNSVNCPSLMCRTKNVQKPKKNPQRNLLKFVATSGKIDQITGYCPNCAMLEIPLTCCIFPETCPGLKLCLVTYLYYCNTQQTKILDFMKQNYLLRT